MIKLIVLLGLTAILVVIAMALINQASKEGDGGLGTLILGYLFALAAIVSGGGTLWAAIARFLT